MTDVRLIVGPPGTGKTTALTEETEAAAAEYGESAVAICSLTRTAAAEIAGRVDVPEEQVGTLHAHAYRALEGPKLAETPEGLRAWNEHHPELRLGGGHAALDDVDQGADLAGERTQADELHAAVMNHRARMTPRAQWTPAQIDYAQHWDDFKRSTDRLDFTDLIEQALEHIDVHPALPKVLLGDECQDFSTLELALFRKWARHCGRAVLAGDTAQALYEWRGADPHAFDRIPEESRRYLRQSHRLPRAVHAAALRWAQTHGLALPDYAPREESGEALRSEAGIDYPEALLDELRSDLDAGRTAMVLTTCGYMLAPALKLLRDEGIPFHNPLRPERGAWNPLRGARRLAAFLRPHDGVWGEHARLWTWGDLLAFVEPLSAADALTRGSKAALEEKCREDQFGAGRAGDEAPTESVMKIFGATSLRHPVFRLDIDWWESKLRASQRKAMAYPLEVARRQGPRALLEKPKVIVGTVHSVKGGEAASVYLAPDLSNTATWQGWHAGGAARAAIVRVGYVGITRAREKLTILSPAGPERMPLWDALEREAMAA